MTLLALLLKISVPPVLVAVMTLAARRWGATFGGLIMGLPWMTGPVVFFLGLDNGLDFLVGAARGAVLAVWAIAAFIMAFGLAGRRFAWPGALAAAVAAYAAAALLVQASVVPPLAAAVVATLLLLACARLLPHPVHAPPIAPPPFWDIPARMAATFALVSVIMLSADLLGPQRSGLIASYPVILTVIGAFTHSQQGSDGLLRVLRGISLSLIAFVAFFAVVAFAAPVVGQVAAYALAAIVALAISATLIALSPHRQARAAKPA
jgi:hypothetical protein